VLYLLTFLAIFWAAVVGLRYKVGSIHLALVFLSAQLIGTYNIGAPYDLLRPTFYLGLGLVCIFAGLALARVRSLQRPVVPATRPSASTDLDRRILFCYVSITGAFIAYHYLVGGIPLLQENILLARFDNTSSGLFGLPGRFNLFGGFFAFFLVVAYYQIVVNHRRLTRLLMAVTLLLLVSRILPGNKGAVVQFMAAVLVVGPHFARVDMNGDSFQRISSGIPRWVLIGSVTAAAIAFIGIATLHISRGIGIYDDVVHAFVRRVTVISGNAFVEATTSVVRYYGHGYGTYFLNDLAQFGSAFGMETGFRVTLNQLVSASVTGRDAFGDLFLVPVTMNGLGYLFVEFGLAGIVIGGVVFGYAMGSLTRASAATAEPLKRAVLFYLQIGLFWILTRGNIGFYVPNLLLPLLVFLGLFRIVALLVRTASGRNSIFDVRAGGMLDHPRMDGCQPAVARTPI
jgi:hypothetical protein